MKRIIRKVFQVMVFLSLASLPQMNALAEGDFRETRDEVILTVNVGDGEGEFQYKIAPGGVEDGPAAFCITADGTIYISDELNKKINVYKDGKYVKSIETPYMRGAAWEMEVSQESVYLWDGTYGTLYLADKEGQLIKKLSGTGHLYLREDGSVWVYQETYGINGEVGKSYPAEDLAGNQETFVEGVSRDGEMFYCISNKNRYELTIREIRTSDNRKQKFFVKAHDYLGSAGILNVDKDGAVYIQVIEYMPASAASSTEWSVRKYCNGECVGVAPYDLRENYFAAPAAIYVSGEGDAYQMKCLEDKVQIVKKAFIDADEYWSYFTDGKEAEENEESESRPAAGEKEKMKDYQEVDFFLDSPDLQCEIQGQPVQAAVTVEGCIRWNEGYMGWFDSMDIRMYSAETGTISGSGFDAGIPAPQGETKIAQNVAYRYFTINGVRVRVTLFADEWGNVSIVMGPG